MTLDRRAVLRSVVALLMVGGVDGIGRETNAQQVQAPAAHRLIVGWDDAVICCGPGTDAGMDSPQAIERMVKRWKARGYQGIYWRVDEAMLPDRFMTRWQPKVSPGMNYLLERVDQELHEFPVLKTLVAAAEREGIEIWAWYPTIYSNGAPPTGPGFTTTWLYENKFGTDHPEVLSVDRVGNKQFMIWEYAYPEARQAKVSEFVQFAKDYGFKRFVACLRTEAAQMQPAPKHADQFGFNPPVVAEMQQKFGVNILTDPRFDHTHPQFDVQDPMVENWRTLRGGHLTQLFRELRQGLDAVDPEIKIAVQIPGDRAGTCLGNWPLEWRTWVDEGLVNELVVPVVLDGHEGYGASARPADFGYIESSVSIKTVRDFVQKSRQPTVRVIQAGGPTTGYRTPPPGADGWRIDSWLDLWCSNMAERWEQWRNDLAEFGHIKFIEQSFDEFPVGNDGYGGGFGDFCHRPDLRSGPGYWEQLGDGTDELAHAQSQTRRGSTGRAMQLTRAASGLANLTVRHHSRHDRSNYPFPGDTAVSSGEAQLDFWAYRPDATSAFVASLQYDNDPAHRFQVGVYVTEAGAVYYTGEGQHVASQATMPVGAWQRIRLLVDFTRQVYSAEIAGEEGTAQSICRDVAYAAQYNAFNTIEFSPQGATGSVLFLDDVSLRWTPSVNFEAAGSKVLLQEGFEDLPAATSIQQHQSKSGARWRVTGEQPLDAVVESDLSYGPEYQSLKFRGAGGRARVTAPSSITWPQQGPIVCDVDLFLRSDQPHVILVPNPSTTGTDEVGLAFQGRAGDPPVLELRTQAGTWRCGAGGTLVDTQVPAAFDAWNHLQIVIDPSLKTYRVLLQVIGSAPRELSHGELSADPAGDQFSIDLFCERKLPRGDGPAFDNLRVTQRLAP